MMITLEDIKSKQDKITALIAKFERQTMSTELAFPAATITLAVGERYAGLILDESGKPHHHVILLPGSVEDKSWDDALEWAKDQGGDLPSRNEQSLLYANLKIEFESSWYWSNQRHEKESGWAWYQHFTNGLQLNNTKASELRARAVRRLVLQ